MPRPQKYRKVSCPPGHNIFKPAGIKRKFLEESGLSLDEYEAIRLADYKGLDHSEASEKMEISRSTFTRLIEKARKKVAEFLIEGKQLTIDGGNIHFNDNIYLCQSCGKRMLNSFETEIPKCTECGSEDIIDLAMNYGHGKCCRKHRFNK